MVTTGNIGGTPEEITRQVADTLMRSFAEAAISGLLAKPALMAKQGTRRTYMVSLPIGELLDIISVAPAVEGEETTNRGITDSWVRSIERGLRRKLSAGPAESKYVIFPFTANIPEGTATFRPLYDAPGLASVGILMIPRSARVELADGRHRYSALSNLIREKRWLLDEAIDLFIIEESDILQQRTDFADGAKVLPINVGLQAWFDSGVSLNKATHKLVQQSRVISEAEIEKFKATVSGRRNPKIWTYNSLRGFVGSALVRGTPGKTEELAEQFEDELSRLGWDAESHGLDEYISQIVECLDMVLEESVGTPLREAQAHPHLVDWDELRMKSWLLKPSGLGAFGLLIHDLRERAETEGPGRGSEWLMQKIKEVAKLDWSSNSPVFKGTLVKGGKTQGSSTAQSHAAIILETKLGVLERVPRRTAESLLSLFESGELCEAISSQEKNIIRMARQD